MLSMHSFVKHCQCNKYNKILRLYRTVGKLQSGSQEHAADNTVADYLYNSRDCESLTVQHALFCQV